MKHGDLSERSVLFYCNRHYQQVMIVKSNYKINIKFHVFQVDLFFLHFNLTSTWVTQYCLTNNNTASTGEPKSK